VAVVVQVWVMRRGWWSKSTEGWAAALSRSRMHGRHSTLSIRRAVGSPATIRANSNSLTYLHSPLRLEFKEATTNLTMRMA